MAKEMYDLVVIGSGPGGYVAALRAAQLGMNVGVVEKYPVLGGTCLNVGCIPSKALLESSELYETTQGKLWDHGIQVTKPAVDLKKMMARKDKVVGQITGGVQLLFKKNKITHIQGMGCFKDSTTLEVEGQVVGAKNFVIATGSKPIAIPGIEVDQELIVDSTGALALSKIPKTMIVMGGGYIGLELGSVYRRLGTQVTVVEALDQILPGMDMEVRKTFARILKKQGFKIKLKTRVEQAQRKGKGVEVSLSLSDGKTEILKADTLLVSVGRRPYTQGLGLETIGVQTNEKGFITVNEQYTTSVPGIYAIGDVIPGPMLAHKASEEGVAVAEILAGQAGQVNYQAIPAVMYTWPEVATVGMTEEQLKERGVEYRASKIPFLANGRALAMGEKEGWVKLLADKNTDRLLGAHIIGPQASNLIAELVLSFEYLAAGEDIARTCHAHPTLSEVIKEAALGLGDGPIHS